MAGVHARRDQAAFRDGRPTCSLCTDAAAEGLNFQFCGALINYDMPWNPMRVEQRIGRIDRLGQTASDGADRQPALRRHGRGRRLPRLRDASACSRGRRPATTDPRASAGLIAERVRDGRPRRGRAAATGRQEVGRNAEAMVSEARGRFDIDEVSEADLAPPKFPLLPYTSEDLDRVLHDHRLLPPGTECNELDPRTYALTIPGDGPAARVTTSPELFDDHFESHQMVLPDSPIFRWLASQAGADNGEPTSAEYRRLSEVLAM